MMFINSGVGEHQFAGHDEAGRIFIINADEPFSFHFLGASHGAGLGIADQEFFADGFSIGPEQVETANGPVANESGRVTGRFSRFHGHEDGSRRVRRQSGARRVSPS